MLHVLNFLIVYYICIVYHSLDCFILVIVLYSSFFYIVFRPNYYAYLESVQTTL